VSVNQVQSELKTAQNGAPDEIKHDVTLIIAFYQSALTQHGKGGMTPELGTAQQHFGTWSKAHCAAA